MKHLKSYFSLTQSAITEGILHHKNNILYALETKKIKSLTTPPITSCRNNPSIHICVYTPSTRFYFMMNQMSW